MIRELSAGKRPALAWLAEMRIPSRWASMTVGVYDSHGGSMRIGIFLIERQARVFSGLEKTRWHHMAMPLDCQLIIFTARAAAEAKRAERAAEAEVDSSHPLGPLMSCSALRLAQSAHDGCSSPRLAERCSARRQSDPIKKS